MADSFHKSVAQWREQLSALQFHVAREGGTEQPFTGETWNETRPGVYHCVCCDTPLFEAAHKFDSGCGWPSFFQPIGELKELVDLSHGRRRTEIRCARCDAHMGHVFNDGPPPTGVRYCINSASMVFKPLP